MKNESKEFNYYTSELTKDLKTLFTGIEEDLFSDIEKKEDHTAQDFLESIDGIFKDE